jgi:hypothetical protein
MFDPASEISPDTKLDRVQTAAALSARGYRTAKSTLASLATRGGGPPFAKYGNSHVLYRWGDALAWAQKRLSAPVNSTSELGPPLANKEKVTVATCRGKRAAAPAADARWLRKQKRKAKAESRAAY